MSGYLWKYYLEDDADSFRQLLETTGYGVRPGAQKGIGIGQGGSSGLALGSSGSLGASPTYTPKGRKSLPTYFTSNITLTRADINSRDASGLTILHCVASSSSENAIGFATALLEHPLTDIYVQDLENGWTALHRAFYFGNITIARSILSREAQDTFGRGAGINQNARGLIKTKDREGNGPLDLYAATIKDRTLHPDAHRDVGGEEGEDLEDEVAHGDCGDRDDESRRALVVPAVDIRGDEVFTFGSNKNVTLGFGDEDDRQFPERISLRRPDHLLRRFHQEHIEEKGKVWASSEALAGDLSHSGALQPKSVTSLPAVIRASPLVIQDVQMSKLHTAILTSDPESNLYMCGHGPGGRLGVGHQATQFQFACIDGGALAGKKVVAVTLGQNHSLALSDEGEIFSWGSNGFGQLGYGLPKIAKDEDPLQLVPAQIFGPMKREVVIGMAASRIHSVAHTSSSLYTFGKNEGQLGLVDADARSLQIQVTPRKVGASLFSSAISSVSAIDRATICLLENREVWVFANYGYAKVAFPLDGFTSSFIKNSFLATRYETAPNRICKVTAGGNTICAMSTTGEVYTIEVSQRFESSQEGTGSTTNPRKIKEALSTPYRVWSLKKSHMAARDVGVDQDGSIILTTEAGSVWRRVKRAKIKDATASGIGEYKPKDYKFSRIPGLTRVTAVRASAYGAYAAVRKDCDVTRTQILVADHKLWEHVFPLLPFRKMAAEEAGEENSQFTSLRPFTPFDFLRKRVLSSKDIEADLQEISSRVRGEDGNYDMNVRTNVSDISIPVHRFMFAGRSHFLRQALADFSCHGVFVVPELLSIEGGEKGNATLTFLGLDILTIFNLVLYAYTDTVVDFWNYHRLYPKLAFRYRQTRSELMKLASRLDMKSLERAVRLQVQPKRTLNFDMELAVKDSTFLDDGDIIVELADEEEVQLHSALACQRVPFFEGMFRGRAGGLWLVGRRGFSGDDNVRVDLTHIESHIFHLVLRHIYADAGEELFDDIVVDDFSDFIALDNFLDLVLEVMSVANELMIDRLSQICQKVIGKYINVRNVCSLLNAIAPSSELQFKEAALEYICLNLEAVLTTGLLDELDDPLLLELDHMVRKNQRTYLKNARSGKAEAQLFERYPDLIERIERAKQAKIDSFMLRSKYPEGDGRSSSSYISRSTDGLSMSPSIPKTKRKASKEMRSEMDSPVSTPKLKGKQSVTQLIFDMDSEEPGYLKERSAKAIDSELVDIEEPPLTEGMSSPEYVAGSAKYEFESLSPVTPLTNRITPGPPAVARPPESPWGAASLHTAKLDLKGIMEQASSARTSAISLGLSAQARKGGKVAGSFGAKMSQKERKKLQQAQQIQSPTGQSTTKPAQVSVPTTALAQPRSAAWKGLDGAPLPLSPLTHTKPISAPQLTMRQTIAGAPSEKAKQPASPASQSPLPSQKSVSGAIAPASPLQRSQVAPQPKPQPSQPVSSAAPTPHSIRHIPLPTHSSPTLALSMADILSQQQAEKDFVREAIAKRSLQEIQQEQEFQEWWDQESKRVQDEARRKEREEKAAARKRGKGGRGRGRGRGGSAAGIENVRDGNEGTSRKGQGGGNAGTSESSAGPTRGRGGRRGKAGKGLGKGQPSTTSRSG